MTLVSLTCCVSLYFLPLLYRCWLRLCGNFHAIQPEPLGRLMPPTVIAAFPAASLVNHSCTPNACFHARRSGPRGPPLEYVLRCTRDIAAGEEVCVSYLAHFVEATAQEVSVRALSLNAATAQCVWSCRVVSSCRHHGCFASPRPAVTYLRPFSTP